MSDQQLPFPDQPPPLGTSSLVFRSDGKTVKSKKQKAVDRLLAQVASLTEEVLREKERLDAALVFHAAEVGPRQQRLAARQADMIRALAPFLDDARLKKAEKRDIRAVLTAQMNEVLLHVGVPDDSLKAVFERVHGITFDEALQQDLAEARVEMEEVFDDLGIDMDLSKLRPGMSEEELAETAAAAAEHMERQRQEAEAAAQARAARRPRTKRALRQEEQARRFEQMRKAGIGAVYRRLVKALHPDREPDDVARAQKSEVMQEVTTAYGRNDLLALLQLEAKWLSDDGSMPAQEAEETLDAYTQLLKQQAVELRAQLGELPYHPRYGPLMAQVGPFDMPAPIDGPAEVERMDYLLAGIEAALARLAGDRALLEVRDIIRTHRAAARVRIPF